MNRKPDLTQAQLFLDDAWIEEAAFVSRQWHQPRKFPDPVLKPEHPWERWCPSLYGTVLHWRGKFRMWYTCWTRDGNQPRTAYAEGADGVAWEKPRLGVCEFGGNKDNNIILDAVAPRYIDDLTVIDDAGDSEWPLKALYWEGATHDWKKQDWGIYLARSKDGIHWDRSPGLVLPQWIDRFNAVSTKLNGQYVVYGRSADLQRGMGRNGRSVWRTESADLIHWSKAKLVLQRDPEDPVNMEYYSASVFPYEGLALGGLERMHMSPDRLDTELIWSHDGGWKWERAPKRPAFLSPSSDRRWDDTWVCLPTNAPIRRHHRLWFYYSGRSGAHGSEYPSNHGAIGLAFLRMDGFASLMAGERKGVVVTKPMRWPKAALHINVDPRRDLASHPGFCTGELRAELRTAANQPIKGFTWDDCVPFTRNTAAAENAACPAIWKKGKCARDLAGKSIRIAFKLHDAHLYSFRSKP
ncbi:MAG: hypothetical protein HY360_08145 [Verrucomicrobia bacterium]|nr:hypothetical protein [Verrucomicrobiota bacterium]